MHGSRTKPRVTSNPERKLSIMKSIITIVAITLFGFLPVTFVHGQTSPKTAAGEKQATTAGAGKRTDVYHVHFAKAALGKALQLGDWLKTPDPNNPMPDYFIVLRHQDGDAWDYVVITHLGPEAAVDAAGAAVRPDKRDLGAWHTDTFVNGPSWEEFTKAMGIDADSKSKTTGSVYSVSYYRPAPGHREQLAKMLGELPNAANDSTAGNVLMQHLEGANWTFLTIARYNSWDDFAKGEKNAVGDTTNKDRPWSRIRDHTHSHTDTLTDRIAP